MSKYVFNGNVYGDVIIVNNNAKVDNPRVSTAKDKLVDLLYKKRDWAKWGGRKGWEEMRHMYEMREYDRLKMHILAFEDSASKFKALGYLEEICPSRNHKNKKHRR